MRTTCPGCGPTKIELESWSPSVYRLFCPCCSSRFMPDGTQIHWASHNDWGKYLCTKESELAKASW